MPISGHDDDTKIKGSSDTLIGNNGDKLKTSGAAYDASYGTVSVGTTAVELKVGGSALADRELLIIQPQGNQLYYGFDSSVTTANGTRIFKNQVLKIDVSDGVTVYAIADTGTIDVRIQELA